MPQVAYLTPLYFDERSYLGGGERYPLNLAKAVVTDPRYQVDIVSYGDVTSVRRTPVAERVTLSVLPATGRGAPQEALSWDVASAIRPADLVHIHQVFSRPSEVALLAAKLLGKPVCATDHGGTTSTLGRSLGMLNLVDRITCYSVFGASLMGSSDRVEIVRGGVDDDFFTPPRDTTRREGVLFVGRLLPHKGIDRLITALPSDMALSVCGRPYHEEYYELLRSLARGKRVEFITSLSDDELRERYRRALAVVLPSVYVDCYGTVQPWPELMGLSLLEGMACGAPAVCSRVGGMPEYVRHDSTGFVYDELSQLRRLLERLAGDPAVVERLGAAGRRAISETYGLRPAGAAMRRVYEDVMLAAG